MAQWLYRIVPTRPEMVEDPTTEEQTLAAEHVDYLVRLRDRGILILAGRTQEQTGTFGIAIFEADDGASARAIAHADPGIAGGLFTVTVHPFRVAVARDGVGEQ